MRPAVLFYVQHLLGIGHLRRAATLTRALQRAGLDVTLVSGGNAIPNLDLGGARLVQLPPTRAVDVYFKELVDADGMPVDEAWRRSRIDALLAAWREARPQVLLFELFPFGRRQMRFELLPLLEAVHAATPRPVVACSLRDILVAQSKPGRNEEMVGLVERWFDHVMVHGDPDFIALDATFPHTARIADRIVYTGYVVDETGAAGGPDGRDEVIVSAGGGAVGETLLRAAMAARERTRLADRTWRVMAGIAMPADAVAALRADAPDGVLVEPARGDFPSLLMNCTLSISQAGYNTVMEALRAGCRTVVSPYAGGLETEQTLRARLLAERGLLQLVPEDDVSPATVAAAVERAMDAAAPSQAGLRTDGAATAAAMVRGWAEGAGRR